MTNEEKLKASGLKYYFLVSDGDGHNLLVQPDEVDRVSEIVEKDYDDWSEEEADLIDSLETLEGESHFIVLAED